MAFTLQSITKKNFMIPKVTDEIWKPLKLKGQTSIRRKYALSSAGRAVSYIKNLHEDGKILNGSVTSGYKTLNLHFENGNGTLYIHREIAKLFCKKSSSKCKYVIHLNHIKEDNAVSNLQWTTLMEMSDHQQNSPEKIAYKIRQANKKVGLKLNAKKVKTIKDILNNPKRKLTVKQLAAKYNVSEMTMYRIKSGENWGHIQ